MKITGVGAFAALFMLSLVWGCNKPPAKVSQKDKADTAEVAAETEDAEKAEEPEVPAEEPESADTEKEAGETEPAESPAEEPAETPAETKEETPEKPAKEEPASEPKEEAPAEEKPAKEEPMKETDPETTVAKADPKEEAPAEEKPAAAESDDEKLAANAEVGPKDWPQWGGTKKKNNVPNTKGVPTDWETGDFDRETGDWDPATAKNIKWVARVGSQTYGNPVIANGKVLVGTNNGAGYIERYPENVDLGCLICFRESDGKFLWQHSNEKLSTGRVHDWPLQGVCCSPIVEGNRCWYVSSRGEVVCLDLEGFHDDENDGPVKDEEYTDKNEADVIWRFDMMKELRTSQHNMCSCSVTILGDILFVNTSNGLDESHVNLPSPDAPTFLAMNKNTGEVYWTDASPGSNILHGQWSSPTVAKLGGVWQVIFAAGDGWVYSFEANEGKDGKPNFLWKFDANPKETEWILGGAGTRNNIIATPVIYDDLVYVAVGQDPEHGEGDGHLWCIDPTKRGDVSAELAFNVNDLEKPIPHKRIQAVVKEEGEVARPNPNSAVVWHYSQEDIDGDEDISFEETMHRSIGTATIKNDLLILSDFSGLVHCLDAKTGKPLWTYDMLAASWGSALIAGDKVYIGDEDGDVSIFNLSGDPEVAMNDGEPIVEINMGNSVYSSPIVANDVLYIANKTHIFAIEEVAAGDKKEAAAEEAPAEEAKEVAAEEKPAEEKAEEAAEEKPAAEEKAEEPAAEAAEESKPAKEEAAEEKPAKEEAAEEKPAKEEKPAESAE